MKEGEINERFGAVVRDPKFRSMPRRLHKPLVDARFRGMFTEQRFQTASSVDKRGRPVTLSHAEDLHEFYDQHSDSDQEQLDPGRTERDVQERAVVDYARGGGRLVSDSSSDDESSSEDEGRNASAADSATSQPQHNWAELDADAVRLSDSEEGTRRLAVCNVDWDNVRAQDVMMLLGSFAPTGGCVRSVRVFLSEFGRRRLADEELRGPAELRPTEVQSHSACLDEYGSERNGDREGSENDHSDSGNSDDEDDVDEDDQMERIRCYQLARLRYYYAVVECDSVATAEAIYRQCDGLEVETSSSRLDLRFVPDETTFEGESERDSCLVAPEAGCYRPQPFVTTALQQRRVRLTWDETDIGRQLAMRRAATARDCDQLDTCELADYVAMSSSEDEEEEKTEDGGDDTGVQDNATPLSEQEKIDRYRRQLLETDRVDSEEHHAQMEITWGVDDDDEVVEKSMSSSDEEVPDEKGDISSDTEVKGSSTGKGGRQSNKKTRLKNRRQHTEEQHGDSDNPVMSETDKQQLELLTMDDESSAERHFNYSQLVKESQMSKKKLKRVQRLRAKEGITKEVDDFCMHVRDERFSRLYDSPLFNIDPSHPLYRRTAGMQQLVDEKQRQIRGRSPDNLDGVAAKKARLVDQALASSNSRTETPDDCSVDMGVLVRNIKARTKRKQAKL